MTRQCSGNSAECDGATVEGTWTTVEACGTDQICEAIETSSACMDCPGGCVDGACQSTCESTEKQGDDVRLTNADGYSRVPSLVWTGTEYGVTWYDYRDGNQEIYFARISASGAKQGDDLRLTNADGRYSESPSLVWTGTEYGVAWADDRDGNEEIYFARLGCF